MFALASRPLMIILREVDYLATVTSRRGPTEKFAGQLAFPDSQDGVVAVEDERLVCCCSRLDSQHPRDIVHGGGTSAPFVRQAVLGGG